MTTKARPDLARTFAILLAGGRGTRLHELTEAECKPALPFAGQRRIVDFTMANLHRSGLDRLLVASQYRPETLHSHLTTRWAQAFGRGMSLRDGRHVAGRPEGYAGTADAVTRNIAEIDAAAPREVIVVAGDHVYQMDYAAMIADHRSSRACVTVAVDCVPIHEASSFGVLHMAPNGRILNFLEKPKDPPSVPGDPTRALVSMGLYVFDWAWLRDVLLRDALSDTSSHDFGIDILPQAVAERVAHGYLPPANVDGSANYWRDVGTLDAYRLAHLDFSRGAGLPPLPGEVERRAAAPFASARMIADAPAPMPNDLHVLLEETAMMPGVRLSPGVRLRRAIVAPRCPVPAGLVVGEDPVEDARWFRVTAGGTTLITPAMLARREAERMRRPATATRPAAMPSHGVQSVAAALGASHAAATSHAPAAGSTAAARAPVLRQAARAVQ